jgi:hypothetical protein
MSFSLSDVKAPNRPNEFMVIAYPFGKLADDNTSNYNIGQVFSTAAHFYLCSASTLFWSLLGFCMIGTIGFI